MNINIHVTVTLNPLQFERFMSMSSKYLQDSLKLIDAIAVGNAADAATQKAVADLTARVTSDEATDADVKAIVDALLQRLATSTPSTGPVVTGLSTASASVTGGETITVTGTGFNGASGVKVGSVDATSFNVVDDTTVKITNPAQAAGTYDVTVLGSVSGSVSSPSAASKLTIA